MKQAFIVLAAAVIMTGCLALGPDYERPDMDLDLPDRYLSAPALDAGPAGNAEAAAGPWWTEFNDDDLNRMVANVLAGNPDLHQAAAAVLEACALAGQARADRFPVLGLEAQALRQKQVMINPLTEEPLTVKSDIFSLSLPASFEVDLWGRLARASEAARAQLLAVEENRQTITQSLVAEAVSRYFNIRSLGEQLQIVRQQTETYQKSLELVEERYRLGLTSILDVQQARRALAGYQAEIPPLVESLGRARQSLAVLQGLYPEVADIRTNDSDRFQLPPPVPAGLPSDLLNRRPDIRAAEAALAAACARIGQAKAGRFPRISLTGTFGYTSDELDLLFEPESELWKIGSGLVQPLFDAGRRKAVQKAAEARYQQQLAAYAKTLLTAFAEVEGALLTREQQIKRLDRLKILYQEARTTQEIAQDRYQRGLSSYLNVLDAQQATFQSELSLVRTRYQIYINRVALYRALGGDWSDRAAASKNHDNG